MKIIKGLGITICIMALTGCGDSNIDAAKNVRFAFDNSLTVGQLFSNRPVCEETTWEKYEDNFERTLVEYRCKLKGSDEYFSDTEVEYVDEVYRFIVIDDTVDYHDGGIYFVRKDGSELTAKHGNNLVRRLKEARNRDFERYQDGIRPYQVDHWPSKDWYKLRASWRS